MFTGMALAMLGWGTWGRELSFGMNIDTLESGERGDGIDGYFSIGQAESCHGCAIVEGALFWPWRTEAGRCLSTFAGRE